MGERRNPPSEEGRSPSNRTNAIGIAAKRHIRRIQEALSLDLLTPGYRASLSEAALSWACQAHCYVATEAAFHLFAKARGFVPHVFRHGDGTTHWWLEHPETGEILDPSAPQLWGKKFDYSKGRRAAFLTKRPSERARELMRRVRRVHR